MPLSHPPVDAILIEIENSFRSAAENSNDSALILYAARQTTASAASIRTPATMRVSTTTRSEGRGPRFVETLRQIIAGTVGSELLLRHLPSELTTIPEQEVDQSVFWSRPAALTSCGRRTSGPHPGRQDAASRCRLPGANSSFGEAEHVGALGVLGAAATFVGRELAVWVNLALDRWRNFSRGRGCGQFGRRCGSTRFQPRSAS